MPILHVYVVVALEYAIEALVELSDATGVKYIEDTFGALRDGNNDLDQMFGYYIFIHGERH